MLTKILNVPSRMVADRVKSCEAVSWALKTHGREMVEIHSGRFAPHLEEGQVMPFETQLQLFEKELIKALNELVKAERRHRVQKAQESKIRGIRDALIREVNAKVAGLRSMFSGVYDDDQLADLGFARRNARLPEELQEQAIHLVARLGQPELELSGSQFGEFDLDAAFLARELEPRAESLQQTLSDLRREERLTEATQVAKDNAMTEYNHAFLWIARTVESLLKLARLDKMAARVRPSNRRPGETEQPFEQPETEGDQPEAEGESDDSPVEGSTPPDSGEASPESP